MSEYRAEVAQIVACSRLARRQPHDNNRKSRLGQRPASSYMSHHLFANARLASSLRLQRTAYSTPFSRKNRKQISALSSDDEANSSCSTM
ncbi:hypothetical protein BCM02_101925 [Paenibacillus methanolicus]|uniref:Uncharacterized protein n=1 Tax=Paenibacillus methanolicus TaxID=582686 RepID=A0A5S5CJX6_9BACL|nr:hypothetical protein BCM02_101925 [Paenibacillus methanolicus]